MFRASLCPSSGGRTVFYCLWFSVLFIVVVMLESRVVRCDEDVASNILVTVHTSCTVHTSHHPTLQHHNNYKQYRKP
jgi:hypothetical protein